MTLDPARTRFPECGGCSFAVDENDPDRGYTLIDGIHFHSDCAQLCLICGEFERECVCSEETKGKHLEYRRAVEALLTVGPTATRDQRPGPFRDDDWPLSDVEVEELEEARVLGVPVSDFARRLENRDIAEFERLDDPYPQREFPEVAMN